MWVFSQDGFVSAVAHRDEKDTLVVRSRDRESIDAVADYCGVQVVKHAGSDYPYRAFVNREDYKSWMIRKIDELDYDNYKNRMHDLRDDNFCSALSNVWLVMTKTEDKEALAGW